MVKTALPLHGAPFQSLVVKSHMPRRVGWGGNSIADEVYDILMNICITLCFVTISYTGKITIDRQMTSFDPNTGIINGYFAFQKFNERLGEGLQSALSSQTTGRWLNCFHFC